MFKKINEIRRNKYVRFGFAITIFLLWVIWVGIYWFLLMGPIIYDMYITKKVNWTFWKKRNAPNPWYIEWLDALIFAVFFVTLINIFLFQNYKIPTGSMEKTLMIGDHLYVSKISYGPRIPNTPLSFPFTQHTMPLTESTPSFIEWPRWPYMRLKGWGTVQRNDKVVFNFPEGDTVCVESQTNSYYSIIRGVANEFRRNDENTPGTHIKTDRQYYNDARAWVWQHYTIIVRPVDKTDNYIKRCVAIAGDTRLIKDGQAYVNGKEQEHFPRMQYIYQVQTNGSLLTDKVLDNLGVYDGERNIQGGSCYYFPLTGEQVESVKKFPTVKSVTRINPKQSNDYFTYFPHSSKYNWSLDNFGPLYIPKKGATVKINVDNICLYERLIDMYEHNDLEIKDSVIYINGKPAGEYTFKYDYYFMMGDNRHSSYDARYWGFVPETHVIGKPRFIWLSLDKNKSFPANIRFSRMFKGV